jgi:hypothetical protein
MGLFSKDPEKPSINVAMHNRLEAWRAEQQQRLGVDIRFTSNALVILTVGGFDETVEGRLDAMAMYVAEAKQARPEIVAVCLDYDPENRVPPTMYEMIRLPEPVRW